MIDVSFDFRTDVAPGADPDASSATLLRYHHLLWSKPLPAGRYFELTPRPRRPFWLEHHSDLGDFYLTSDTVLATFTRRLDMRAILAELPRADINALDTLTYTIGGMMLWPGSQVGGRWTINQARGCHPRIVDRFDLTVECIRRHYAGDATHPLAAVFTRYAEFFDLFDDFAGFVEFWLLDDLVDADGSVRLFLASDDFTRPAVPRTVTQYVEYCACTVAFVTARNERICQLGL